jgi:four helix bundle protein
LEVWQFGIKLTKQIYELTRTFPKHEIYGLCSQMQRAAVSVPANIAEGHARSSTKEFLHHLSFARGSLAEVETMLTIATELQHCQSAAVAELLQLCDRISRMIAGLSIASTKKSNETPDPHSPAPTPPPP